MKRTVPLVPGTVLCLTALAAWSCTAPAEGSVWILLVAFVSTLSFLQSIGQSGQAAVASVIITVSSGIAWYLNSGLEHSGWVLGLFILCALQTIDTLSKLAKAAMKNKE